MVERWQHFIRKEEGNPEKFAVKNLNCASLTGSVIRDFQSGKKSSRGGSKERSSVAHGENSGAHYTHIHKRWQFQFQYSVAGESSTLRIQLSLSLSVPTTVNHCVGFRLIYLLMVSLLTAHKDDEEYVRKTKCVFVYIHRTMMWFFFFEGVIYDAFLLSSAGWITFSGLLRFWTIAVGSRRFLFFFFCTERGRGYKREVADGGWLDAMRRLNTLRRRHQLDVLVLKGFQVQFTHKLVDSL